MVLARDRTPQEAPVEARVLPGADVEGPGEDVPPNGAGADEVRGTAGTQDNAAPAVPAVDPATRRLLDLLLAELPPARAARLAHAISGVPRETLYALALTAGGR